MVYRVPEVNEILPTLLYKRIDSIASKSGIYLEVDLKRPYQHKGLSPPKP